MRGALFLVILALCFGCGGNGSGDNPPRHAPANPTGPTPPKGARNFPETGGGEAMVWEKPGATSARALARESLDRLAGRLDARPVAVGAIGDVNDRILEALFAGTQNGKPIRGIVLVHIAREDGVVGIAYDREDRISTTFPRLARRISSELPGPAHEQVNWFDAPFPDGSGALRLPRGWRITSSRQGMVSAEGPHGRVDLGLWVQVYTPRAARRSMARPPLVASYGDAYRTVRELVPQLNTLSGQTGGVLVEIRKLIDRARIEVPRGLGDLLHIEFDRIRGGRRETWQSLSLVLQNPNLDGSFVLYTSTVASPKAAFGANLPILLQIWRSYRVNNRLLQDRITRALQSMRETTRLIEEAVDYRRKVFARANDDWTEYIRETTIVRDQQTGEIQVLPAHQARTWVNQRNRQEGWELYKVVPLKDLNHPR